MYAVLRDKPKPNASPLKMSIIFDSVDAAEAAIKDAIEENPEEKNTKHTIYELVPIKG
jgi:hypothetical protein